MASMESTSAVQAACRMEVETPTVPKLCTPSVERMKTRTREAVPPSETTRTLKSVRRSFSSWG